MKTDFKTQSPGSCAPPQFDPLGPDQIKLPRGRFTFAHLTLAVLALAAAGIVIAAIVVG
jgi:hypothetical protein